MKIFYSFSGHGYGHAVRSSVVIRYLEKLGHQVKAATYGQGFSYAKKNKLTDVLEIKGFRMYYTKTGLSNIKTLLNFFDKSPKVIFSNVSKLKRVLKNFKPDLIISDFEPFSAYWANWKDIPLMTVNNQSAITLTKIKIPIKFFSDYLTAMALVALFSPVAQTNFILSFNPVLTPVTKWYRKNVFLVPPILREQIFSLPRSPRWSFVEAGRQAGLQSEKKEFILVYQTSPVYQKKLVSVLSHLPDTQFYIYNLKASPAKNLVVKNFSEKEFLDDLAHCRGVISNGGFGLISEAIYLKKPVLSLPIENDFEQILNAILLEQSAYGKFGLAIDMKVIKDFLNNLETFEKNLDNYHQDKNKTFETKLKNVLNNI